MAEVVSKEEFDKLVSFKGEVRGLVLKPPFEFILQEEGKEGLKKVEEIFAKFDHPVKLREIQMMSFYPSGLKAAVLVIINKLFGYDDKKFYELGRFSARVPYFIRFLFTKFISLERFRKESPGIWRKCFTFGDFEMAEADRGKRQVILRIKNFHFHPLECQSLAGIFSSVFEMLLGKDRVTCEETKCVHRGDQYHEFLLNW